MLICLSKILLKSLISRFYLEQYLGFLAKIMISGIGLDENNVTNYPGSEIVYIRLPLLAGKLRMKY